MKEQLSPFLRTIAIFTIVQVVGVAGFVWIEGYSVLDAIYMTIITVSTVGFGEVQSLSQTGKLFTTFLILINIGLFAYFVSILSSYIFEGRLRHVFKRYMIDRRISTLKDHVIVCGYGRNGREACKELERSGFTFVIVESDHEVIESLPDDNAFHFVVGDATDEDTLRQAHVEKAAQIIITTSSDADNVFIALSARKMNPDMEIIARATKPESESKLYFAGANHVVMPDQLGGMFMAHMITKPVTIEFLNHLTGRNAEFARFHLESIHYDQLKPKYRDKSLRQMKLRTSTGCNVIGVKDDIKGIIPSPAADTVIGPKDCMIILGANENIKKARDIFTQ